MAEIPGARLTERRYTKRKSVVWAAFGYLIDYSPEKMYSNKQRSQKAAISKLEFKDDPDYLLERKHLIMKITEDKWKEIVKYYDELKQSSMIGSVNSIGQPNVTPIGSLILKDDYSGYYFDLFTKELSDNLDQNQNVCVLFVNSGKLFWLKSLYTNECKQPPGIKLIGSAGNRRKATAEEIAVLRKKIKPLKIFKGYHSIFGNLSYVRDIVFTDYFMINTGKMTSNL